MVDGTVPQEHELAPGDVCDGYRIVSLIAAGGMGDVYEAVHDASGKTVAIKCLKVRYRNKEDARARMKMEAVVLSELQHENLVQVYDAGLTDAGMVWIAMERLHGQTLRDILFRARSVPIADALYYASEIADGVDAVHEVNVIHRDLKPENIFVTDRQIVKVLDLGTGKFTGYGLNSTDRMRVVGTTAYMSPEQIKGVRVDARADVYALGLIVYEMIAGRHALALDDGLRGLPQAIEQIALMQLQMTPQALAHVAPGCPSYVSAVVDRAIMKERERRFPNMSSFARELRATRKRFIAENQLETAGRLPEGEGLREKFGAPPRVATPPKVAVRVANALMSPADESRIAFPLAKEADEIDAFPTEVQAPLCFMPDGSTLISPQVPTLLLSSSYASSAPPGIGERDSTSRVSPLDDVRNRTTHTNPIGFAPPTELSPTELSVAGIKRRSRFSVWRHPVVRRVAVTLGLGALIGVPPAVLGVLWSAHRRAHASHSVPSSGATNGQAFVAAPIGPEPVPSISAGASATRMDPPPTTLTPPSEAPRYDPTGASPVQTTTAHASTAAARTSSPAARGPVGARKSHPFPSVPPPTTVGDFSGPNATTAPLAAPDRPPRSRSTPAPSPAPDLATPKAPAEDGPTKTILPPSGL